MEQFLHRATQVIDHFIPDGMGLERSELSVARNFVFTHLIGPLLAQGIVIYLYRTDPDPGFACWTIIACIYLFWALPFVYRKTRSLRLSATLSVQLLTFTSLFGTYFYGGASSPFLPWLIVALLLGFFYLSDRPFIVIGLFAVNFLGLMAAYATFGFASIVPIEKLTAVGWISIFSATVYMSWMALYYANVMSMRSEIERETELFRQATEKLEEAKKQAEAANQAKSVFLAKMSHELRTPLNAVIGYSELIMEMMDPSKAGSQKEQDLKRINSSGKHLLSLVNDVLDLSKIEADTIEIREEIFDANEFCNQVAATAGPLMRQHDNSFVVQCAPRLGNVTGDETKLRQVVLNLLSNAAKFTKNGTVSLILRRKTIGAADWVEIQVIDTGIGISREDQAKLFQNYSQASAETAAKYGGTGLGLAISQKLCSLMGASITMTSEIDRGSSFTVRVPADMSGAAPVSNDNIGLIPQPLAAANAAR